MKQIIRISFFAVLSLWFFMSGCQKTISGTGYVYDKSTKLPIQGANVIAYLNSPSSDAAFMSTQTDAKGSYYVRSQPYSSTGTRPDLYVSISKPGYQGAYVKNPNNDTTYLVHSR
ncbi:MAG: carboxypeptidase regulatory-like domain-containing protein [Bacteroidales bacterium]|nr:carboxypeptidase regulatory-like domain-containing protein [Bacteroidales bacterium]